MDATKPIAWTGNLDDDCIAKWNGLILRAERMDEDVGWWAVSEDNDNPMDQIDSSNNYDDTCFSGKRARQLAEMAAKKFINSNGKSQ